MGFKIWSWLRENGVFNILGMNLSKPAWCQSKNAEKGYQGWSNKVLEDSQKSPGERKRKNQLGFFKCSRRVLGTFYRIISACFQLVLIFEPFGDLEVGLGNLKSPNFNHDLEF